MGSKGESMWVCLSLESDGLSLEICGPRIYSLRGRVTDDLSLESVGRE